MMTNCAASGSADFPVSSHVTSQSADDCALDASLGLGRRGKRKSKNGGANDKSLHGFFSGLGLAG